MGNWGVDQCIRDIIPYSYSSHQIVFVNKEKKNFENILKVQDKKKTLQAIKTRKLIISKGTSVSLLGDFAEEIWLANRKQNERFQVSNGKAFTHRSPNMTKQIMPFCCSER